MPTTRARDDDDRADRLGASRRQGRTSSSTPGATLRVYADLLPASDGTAPFAIHTFNQITGGSAIYPRQAAIANDHFVFTGREDDDKQTSIGRAVRARSTASRSRTTRRQATASSISTFPSRGWCCPGSSFPAPTRTAAPTARTARSAWASDRRRSGSDGRRATSTSRCAKAAPRRVQRPAAALGQRQGHRPRAAAAVGRAAVAGHVGGARRRRRAAADRLSQHDREHDGGGRGAERHLRARRRSPTRGIAQKGIDRRCRIRASRPARTRVYEIDEELSISATSRR